MTNPCREVLIVPRVLAAMEAGHPTDTEREAIRTVLAELGTDLSRAYRIFFVNPPIYRIDVGRFRIHFRYDEKQVQVGFVGVY